MCQRALVAQVKSKLKTLKGGFAPPALSTLSQPELSSVLGGRTLSQSWTADAGMEEEEEEEEEQEGLFKANAVN